MDRLDERPLVVGLDVLEREAVLSRRHGGLGDVVGQGVAPVDLRLALAQQVEVRPGQQQHDRVREPLRDLFLAPSGPVGRRRRLSR